MDNTAKKKGLVSWQNKNNTMILRVGIFFSIANAEEKPAILSR